jgi:predicted Rossmann-fold nucleotide-binding protein
MDELFEIITLIQTKKKNMELPIIFFDSLFFKKMLEFIEEMEKNNLISSIDKQLLCMVDSVDDAFSIIKNHINNHFMKKI